MAERDALCAVVEAMEAVAVDDAEVEGGDGVEDMHSLGLDHLEYEVFGVFDEYAQFDENDAFEE